MIAHPKVISTPHLGASTEEAQQRVAEEIAQQFLVLAGRSTEYVITGIVNAPMLSAAISDENASWIELSKKLGNLISRILKGKLNITVHNQIIGNKEMEKKHSFTQLFLLESYQDKQKMA